MPTAKNKPAKPGKNSNPFRSARSGKGLSLSEVAHRLTVELKRANPAAAPVQAQTVGAWERGLAFPRKATLEAYCTVMGAKPGDFYAVRA